MSQKREHSTKTILISFLDGGYWEEWEFRFNEGSKQNKPAKSFANRMWRSDLSRSVIPFSGTHWDYESKRHAEQHFAEEAAAHGGSVVNPTAAIISELIKKFGYVRHERPNA